MADVGIPGHCFNIDGEWWHPPGECSQCGGEGQCCWPTVPTPEPVTARAVDEADGFVTSQVRGSASAPGEADEAALAEVVAPPLAQHMATGFHAAALGIARAVLAAGYRKVAP